MSRASGRHYSVPRLRPEGRARAELVAGELRHRGPVKASDVAPYLEKHPGLVLLVGLIANALDLAAREAVPARGRGRPATHPAVTEAISRAVKECGPRAVAIALLGCGSRDRNGRFASVAAHRMFPGMVSAPHAQVDRTKPDSLALVARLAKRLGQIARRARPP